MCIIFSPISLNFPYISAPELKDDGLDIAKHKTQGIKKERKINVFQMLRDNKIEKRKVEEVYKNDLKMVLGEVSGLLKKFKRQKGCNNFRSR